MVVEVSAHGPGIIDRGLRKAEGVSFMHLKDFMAESNIRRARNKASSGYRYSPLSCPLQPGSPPKLCYYQ